tara:strand:+ start:544 stop:1179 length:636 start_codon:yes stop_codon:yes gene_type:complete
MEKILNKDDISLIKVIGDSNCLFNCIVQQLHLDRNIKYYVDNNYTYKLNQSKEYEKFSEDLRQSVVDWLDNNLDFLLPTGLTIKEDILDSINYDENLSTIRDYLLDMRGYKFAGQIEIYALSNMLKKNISVLTEIDDTYYSLGMGNIYNGLSDDNIYLYHNMLEQEDENEYHYNLLYLNNNSKIITKKKYLELNNRISKPLTRNTFKALIE